MMTLYTFMSVHHLMRAEKALKEGSVFGDVIPTPREISTSCGLCMVVADADTAFAEEIFRQKEIMLKGIYRDAQGLGYYKAEGNKA